MSTEAPVAQATPAPVETPTPTPSPSPRSPVPIDTNKAHLELAKTVWNKEPAKAPTPPATPPPAKVEVKAKAEAPAATPEAPKPAEPAKTATVEFPEDKLAEPVHEGAKAGWKELKAIAKQERNRAAELEAKVAELTKAQPTAAPVNTAELDTLRAELKASQDRLLVLDVKNHPDFHKRFVAPVEKAFKESELLLKDSAVEVPDFAALLSKPRAEFAKTVSELAGKMNSFDAQTFTANMRDAYRLRGEEAHAMQNASGLKEQLAQRAQQQQRSAFEAEAKENLSHFQPIEIPEGVTPETKAQLEAWNAAIPQIRKDAEAIAFGKVDERGVARMSLKAAALDPLVKHVIPGLKQSIQDRDAHIAALTAELTAMKGNKAPPAGGGDTQPANTAPQTIEQMAKAVWNKR